LKKDLEIGIPIIVVIAGALLMWALLTGQEISKPIVPQPKFGPNIPYGPHGKPAQSSVPSIPTKPSSIPVKITQHSPEIFAYAHGTVMADGKIFIGMSSRSGNPFPTNQLIVFTEPSDLRQFLIISIPKIGDIESMVYDRKNDKIYFTLSNNGALDVYRIDPKTYFISTVISTTSINIGLKPAITTDGEYIYGITYTDPSIVFKVGIYGTPLVISTASHIPNGHSAAIGIYGSTTELYFGGGEADGFEKVDGDSLASLGSISFRGCSITDDTPYERVDDPSGYSYGYVYLGCEREPIGYRVRSYDMNVTKFSLPGSSFGMNIFGSDLYNAAQDGNYDVFKNMDISNAKRYYVGQDIQLNELFMTTNASTTIASTSSQSAQSLYFTGWWGVKGLFGVNL
jgi:hypothetical protein